MKLFRLISRSILAGVALSSLSAQATVDVILDYTVVYRDIQTDDYCYKTLPFWAEIGIPAASYMQASLSPTQIFRQSSLGTTYVDINAITKDYGPLRGEYVNDTFDEATGINTYSMRVDLRSHPLAGNTSVAARQELINIAKFALLAMNQNLARTWPGKYRLFVTYEGLPSQTGLSGTRLNARTTSAYNSSSSLIRAYESELINRGGNCN